MNIKTLAATALTGAALVAALATGHAAVTPAPAPAIPRCVNDDFNDGTQARCWTETTRHHVLVIDRKDRVISDRS